MHDNRQETPEWRIAERAHRVMKETMSRYAGAPYGPILPSVGDFYNGIMLDVQLLTKTAGQAEMANALGEDAQRKGRASYMIDRVFELQREMDKLEDQIKNRP